MEGRRIGSWSNGDEENNEEIIKKGPWKAEEDQVLLDHVNKYGPRDWSSIRSNGLLRRTGKSCRLRWVNKLRPNLKNGVKFSAEEERTVIDLQAQFGNKWARIATYLPGRTDNDVKNFWSSRQKRLARAAAACKQQLQPQQRLRRDGTAGVKPPTGAGGLLPPPPLPPSPLLPPSHETAVAPSKLLGASTTTREEEKGEEVYWRWLSKQPSDHQYCSSTYVDYNFEAIQMLDLINNNNNNNPSSSFPFDHNQLDDNHLINHLPCSFLPLPYNPLQDNDYYHHPDFPSVDVFGDAKEQQQQQQCVVVKHETGDDAKAAPNNNNNNNNNPLLRSPDSFIDDFPIDMFDNIEHLPSPI